MLQPCTWPTRRPTGVQGQDACASLFDVPAIGSFSVIMNADPGQGASRCCPTCQLLLSTEQRASTL